MKTNSRWIIFAAISVLIGVAFFAGVAFGTDFSELIRVYRNSITVMVNGTKVTADNFVYNGRTYIPIRAVAEMLSKDVGWNAITNVASIKDMVYQKDELSKLLPNNAGFKWIYNGFAEYDHNMTLNSINDQAAKRTYYITGIVGDPSGGEGTANRNIDLQYIIENNNLIQQKSEQVMMDSIFNRITLIQTPLVAGTYWEERLIDKTGKIRDIYSQITKVETLATGAKQYTVRYSDSNSAYFEQRVIREGVGIVNFEKLYQYDGGSTTIGYFLINQDNVVYKDITLYFSDSNADKLWAEERNVPVIDSRIAYAAIQALIDGPQTSGHYRTISEGTIILNIGISNGICTVNFSREFIDNHWGGSAGELLTLGSIVNTLTEFPTIQKVMILVDGKAGETLGNILLDQPFERMNDMIGK
jgi:hypothetical protein